MPYPSLTFANTLDNATRQELEQFISLLQGYLAVQHKEDGTHSAITGDSLVLSGPLAATIATLTGLIVNGSAAVNGTTTLTQTGTVGALANLDATGSFGQVLYKANGTTATVTFEWNHGGNVRWLMNTGTAFQWRDVSNNLVLQATNAGLLERNRSTPLGDYTSVTFAAGSFTTDAGSWTLTSGDQITFKYRIIGKSLLVKVTLQTTTVAGGPTDLKVAIPGSFTAAADMRGVFHYNDNGTKGTGYWYVVAAGTVINFRKVDDSTWANATDATNVEGDAEFEVS